MTARSGPPLEIDDVLAGATVEVGGLEFELHATDVPRAEAIAALLRHAPRSAAAGTYSLTFSETGVDLPDPDPTDVLDVVEVWRPDPETLVLRGTDGLTARASPEGIVVGGDARSLARGFRFLCTLALTHLLARHDRFVLHGGAFVVDGRAVLVIGETSTGKSTLVCSALRLGWLALSDDLVAVHRDDDGVHAVGLPRPIAVPADVLPDGLVGIRPVPDDPRRRMELPGSALDAGVHRVAAVVETSRGSNPETTLAPLSGLDGLRTVLTACSSLGDPLVLRDVFAVAGALARLPAWSLQHGTDPARRLDGGARRLEELRAALDLGAVR